MVNCQQQPPMGLRSVDTDSALKLEAAYQGFLDQLERLGPDHIDTCDLVHEGQQFQVILTKSCVDNGNRFWIENQSTLEQRQLLRITEEPRMNVQYSQTAWQVNNKDNVLERLDVSSSAAQAAIEKFCTQAELRFGERGPNLANNGRQRQNRIGSPVFG